MALFVLVCKPFGPIFSSSYTSTGFLADERVLSRLLVKSARGAAGSASPVDAVRVELRGATMDLKTVVGVRRCWRPLGGGAESTAVVILNVAAAGYPRMARLRLQAI
jgi:hypothetical protein